MNKKVTVCMTSYKRYDLLLKTVDSFLANNTYPIERFVIIDDSVDKSMEKGVRDHYEGKVDLIFNEENLGQIKSLDKMYKTVDTEYIFHTEEDYLYTGNPNFIKDSIDILEERKDVCQVHIKGIGHGNDGLISEEWVDHTATYKTSTGVDYKLLNRPHCGGWYGFSFNPGLRRTEDYNRVFPNGYGEFTKQDVPDNDKAIVTEYWCNVEMQKNGFCGAVLLNPGCQSIGHWFSTYRKKGQGGIL